MRKKISLNIKYEDITLKLIEQADIERYYKDGFSFVDKEVMFYTGTKHIATKEDINVYVQRIIPDNTRYDFLITKDENIILGESVLNEIDWEIKSANYRICLFKKEYCNQHIGTKVIQATIKFGFEVLKLNRIELEVFDFNQRAYSAYRHIGFVEEGRKRQAEYLNGTYCDVIIMSILQEEYFNLIKEVPLLQC